MTLTLLLLAVYAAITIGLGVVVGGDSAWVVALATLVVALVFRPCAHEFRISSTAGTVGLGTRVFDAFGPSRTKFGTAPRAPEEIGVVLADALQDPLAEIFLLDPETGAYAGDRGPAGRAPARQRARREIQRDDAHGRPAPRSGAARATRSLRRRSRRRRSLDRDGAAARRVRLQLAEVQASRARIVEAGYEERRRLERDLHDGAQQRLVSLGVQVRRLQLSLPRRRPDPLARARPDRRRGG